MSDSSILQNITLGALPFLFALTVRETARGWVAERFGDRSPRAHGRLTLDPRPHIDILGTLVMPLLLLAIDAPFLIGWAKPMPIDYGSLKDPRKDQMWISASGLAANFVMAVLWGWMANLAQSGFAGGYSDPLFEMAKLGILINLSLMVLNLLPLPPLDGGRILVGLLPYDAAAKLVRIEPYSFFILLGLMLTGVLGVLILPLLKIAYALLLLFI